MRVRQRHPVRAGMFLVGAMLLTACGDDSSSPTGPSAPTYESIASTYTGVLGGTTQGVDLAATFSLTVNQSSGTLSGSWSMNGMLDDGVISVPVSGTGSLSGSIASGSNPSVNITFASPCPGRNATFSGAYDSTNRVLTLNGPVYILDGCDIFLTYQGTVILNR